MPKTRKRRSKRHKQFTGGPKLKQPKLRQELRQLFAEMNEHQKAANTPESDECDFCSHYLTRMAEIAELAPDVFFPEMFSEAQTRPEGSVKLDVISPETTEKEIEAIIDRHAPDGGFSITQRFQRPSLPSLCLKNDVR